MRRDEVVRMCGAALIAVVVLSCGGPVVEMAADAFLSDASVDAVSDAAAQPTCGNCTTGGALRIVTADTDPTRLVRGIAGPSDEEDPVIAGPFVLTDIEFERANSVDASITPTNCYDENTERLVDVESGRAPMHGGRFFVPAGFSLCLRVSVGDVYWAGFRPYD